jgi:hypothetical protein
MNMKWLVSALAAVAILVAPVTFSGCATAPRNASQASAVTHVGAKLALGAWNEYLGVEYAAAAALPADRAELRKAELIEKEKRVRDAFNKYQVSQLAVLTSAQEVAKIPPADPNAPDAQDRLTAAVQASAVALAQVLTVLEAFGVAVK